MADYRGFIPTAADPFRGPKPEAIAQAAGRFTISDRRGVAPFDLERVVPAATQR